jgi:molecular chaperone DnaJ
VNLVVDVPTRLSKEAKDLLRQFDEITGNSLTAAASVSDPDGSDTAGGKKKKNKFFKA